MIDLGGDDQFFPVDDASSREMAVRREQAFSVQDDILATFTTPAGERVLDWLRSQTVHRRQWAAGSQLRMDQITALGLHQQGANDLVALIEMTMQQARKRQDEGG